ncbi:acyltransferase family protein [Clostridium perfringens]|uniref:acyltransferase n=1 Tax=Clostridium perfringens TaxID=1502 RepID=UPI0013E3D630|nr:acyltransferase family protein [Clostridium perfringens]NGT56782.1 acyltransferase family protein [Clostridium perfringens]
MQEKTLKNAVETRVQYLDILRALAIFAVIMNHTYGYFSIENFNLYKGSTIFYLDNFLVSISRFDVPIFFMISGAILLNNKNNMSLKYLFKKRILKILIPFMIWNLFYIIVFCYIKDLNILKEFIGSIFSPRTYSGHLWYLYTLLSIYLILPVIDSFISKANNKMIDYILILWLIFSCIIPLVNHFVSKVQIQYYADLNILGGYLGYYILGYRLSKTKKIFNEKILFTCFILATCFTFFIGCFYQNIIGHKDVFFQSFLTPNVIMMSATIFLFFKQFNNKLIEKYIKMISDISKLSFGIYLVHFLFKDLIIFLFNRYNINPYIYLIFSPILVFILSYLLTKIISKLKISKYLIGVK